MLNDLEYYAKDNGEKFEVFTQIRRRQDESEESENSLKSARD